MSSSSLCDYKNAHLAGDELSNEEFTNCDFTSVDLCEAQWLNCIIRDSNMSHAKLEYADFSGTKFILVDFTDATLERANFENCVFEQCTFRVRPSSCILFEKVNLHNAVFDNTDLLSCGFEHAPFKELTIRNTVIKQVKLKDFIRLEDVILDHVTFDTVNFEGSLKPKNATNIICRGNNIYDEHWRIRPSGWPE